MNFGIVVEGPSDRATYPVLIRKIRPDVRELQVRECGGKSKLTRTYIGFLKEFGRNPAWQIQAAIVIADSDCRDPAIWEMQMRDRYAQSGTRLDFPVHFHATKCEVETWLLADQNAITQASRSRGKNKVVAEVQPRLLESEKAAKELFGATLSLAGLPADPSIYHEVATFSDIRRIIERCPDFRRFADKINRN